MNIRWLCLALMLAMLLLPACGGSDSDNNEEVGVDPEMLRQEIENVLRQNPELVLDILRQNSEMVFEFAEAGLETKQLRARISRYQEDLISPREPVIEPDRPMRGDPNAPITIVEYSDFQCPYCANAARTVDRIVAEFHGQVNMVFKHTPLGNHPHALDAALMFEAASLQDEEKAWLLHDAMFLERSALNERGKEFILEVAETIGLDPDQLEEDAASTQIAARIDRDMNEADRFGFTATPAFVVGGVEILGDAPIEEFAMVVDMVMQYRASQPGAAQEDTGEEGAAQGGETTQ
ncbi:MAG: disulfide bond formation protein DsbA [Desulfovibrio sp.]|nr:MAG: disulfide bond formation protein DsbA [Desulfovibrio sp.]